MWRLLIGIATTFALINATPTNKASIQDTAVQQKQHVAIRSVRGGMCNGVLVSSSVVLTSYDCITMLNLMYEPAEVLTTGRIGGQRRFVSAVSDTKAVSEQDSFAPKREVGLVFLASAFSNVDVFSPQDWDLSTDVGAGSGAGVNVRTVKPCAINEKDCIEYGVYESPSFVGGAEDWPYTEGGDTLNNYRSRFDSDFWLAENIICPNGCQGCGDYGSGVMHANNGKLLGIARGAFCGTIDGQSGCIGGAGLAATPTNRITKGVRPAGSTSTTSESYCTARDNFIRLTSEDQSWVTEQLAGLAESGSWTGRMPDSTDCFETVSLSNGLRHNAQDSVSVCVEVDPAANEIWLNFPKGFMVSSQTALDTDRLFGVSKPPDSIVMYPARKSDDVPSKIYKMQLRWIDPIPLLTDNNAKVVYFEIDNIRNPNNCDRNGEWSIDQWNCPTTDLLQSGTTMTRNCPLSPVDDRIEVTHDVNTYPSFCNLCNACYKWTSGNLDGENTAIMRCEHDGVEFTRTTKDNAIFLNQNCYLDGVGPLD